MATYSSNNANRAALKSSKAKFMGDRIRLIDTETKLTLKVNAMTLARAALVASSADLTIATGYASQIVLNTAAIAAIDAAKA